MAWTNTISQNLFSVSPNGRRTYLFKINCVSDGNALTDTQVNTLTGFSNLSAEAKNALQFGKLISLTTVPGAAGVAPDNTYTVLIKSGLGATLITAATRSMTVTEYVMTCVQASPFCPNVLGFPFINIADIGSAADETNLYLEMEMF
jgi:hypothetical protein